MAFENYTIREFMNAWFKDDRSVMNDDEFEQVKTEYIDVAGLFDTDEFSKICYIHFLSNRINSIKLSLKLQRMFLDEFDCAYKPGIPFINKFGHNVVWKDKDTFIKDLDMVEKKEKKYISQLEKNIKELKDMRANKKNEIKSEKDIRPSFIRTVNSLGKAGYRIDNDKTTVEELAYMIKQQVEESEIIKSA